MFRGNRRSNTDHSPVGYGGFEVALNNELAAVQLSEAATSYFQRGHLATPETFDINWGDICYTSNEGIAYTGLSDFKDKTANYAAVISALNGVDVNLGLPAAYKESHAMIDAAFFLNHTVIGSAAAEMHFFLQKKFDLRLFAIAYSGIKTKHSNYSARVGDTLFYTTPNKRVFSEASYKPKEGVSAAKITLELCPFRQVDSYAFAVASYNLFHFVRKTFNRGIQDTAAKIATIGFGKSLEAFALAAGNKYLYNAMLLGYVEPSRYTSNSKFHIISESYLKNIDVREGSPTQVFGSDLFFKLDDANRNRVGFRQGGGDKARRANAPKDPVVRIETPEQAAQLMAVVTGVVDSKPDTGLPAKFQYSQFLQKADYELGDRFKNLFLQGLFPRLKFSEVKGLSKDDLKIGAHTPGAEELTSKYLLDPQTKEHKYIVKNNGYGELQRAYNHAFTYLINGIHQVNQSQMSRRAGMSLTNTEPNESIDYIPTF